MGSTDKQGLLALTAEEVEWIIPGKDWPLAGTHRGRAGLEAVLQNASKEIEMTYPKPPEFVAQGDRVLLSAVNGLLTRFLWWVVETTLRREEG